MCDWTALDEMTVRAMDMIRRSAPQTRFEQCRMHATHEVVVVVGLEAAKRTFCERHARRYEAKLAPVEVVVQRLPVVSPARTTS